VEEVPIRAALYRLVIPLVAATIVHQFAVLPLVLFEVVAKPWPVLSSGTHAGGHSGLAGAYCWVIGALAVGSLLWFAHEVRAPGGGGTGWRIAFAILVAIASALLVRYLNATVKLWQAIEGWHLVPGISVEYRGEGLPVLRDLFFAGAASFLALALVVVASTKLTNRNSNIAVISRGIILPTLLGCSIGFCLIAKRSNDGFTPDAAGRVVVDVGYWSSVGVLVGSLVDDLFLQVRGVATKTVSPFVAVCCAWLSGVFAPGAARDGRGVAFLVPASPMVLPLVEIEPGESSDGQADLRVLVLPDGTVFLGKRRLPSDAELEQRVRDYVAATVVASRQVSRRPMSVTTVVAFNVDAEVAFDRVESLVSAAVKGGAAVVQFELGMMLRRRVTWWGPAIEGVRGVRLEYAVSEGCDCYTLGNVDTSIGEWLRTTGAFSAQW
jgi:hypothetical protein